MTDERRSIRSASVLLLVVCGFAISGCVTKAEPDPLEDIVDKPPYVCTVIPRNAVSLIFPTLSAPEAGPPVEARAIGSFGSDDFLCRAESGDGFSLLHYQHRVGKLADDWYRQDLEFVNKNRDRMNPVPARIGEGWVETVRDTYGGWVYWQCGDRRVLSGIGYRVAPADDKRRNVKNDTLRMLEIAQQRYAEINKCEARPSGSASPTATESPVLQ